MDNYLDDPYLEEDKQEKTDKLLHRLSEYLLVDIDSDIFTQGRDDIRRVVQAYQEEHNKKAEAIPFNEEQTLRIRQFAMMTIDRYWIRHLDDLTRKKEGSSLRQYEQEDHTQIFKRETYQLFTEMFTLLKLELGIQYKKLAQAALEKDKGDQA